MRILYRFGDNDFHSTFFAVFENIGSSFVSSGKVDALRNPVLVCQLINDLAYTMYRVYQDESYPSEEVGRFSSEEERRDFYTKYFEAKPEDIYYDSSIEDLVAEFGVNMEWFGIEFQDYHAKGFYVFSV